MDKAYEILTVPFSPSYERYRDIIRIEAYPEAEPAARELFDIAVSTLQPKSIHTVAFIDHREVVEKEGGRETCITVGDTLFRGKVLQVLDEVYRLFPYIATCGNEMESYDLSGFDMLAPFWLDTIKMMALNAIRLETTQHIRNTYGLTKMHSVNPGSGNVDIWPVQELRSIFSLLNGGDPVGVTLTESSLMLPNKSVSGLFYESEVSFSSCLYCERENCPGRKEPFSGVRL